MYDYKGKGVIKFVYVFYLKCWYIMNSRNVLMKEFMFIFMKGLLI